MNIEKMREQFELAIVAMKIATGMPEDDARSFLEVGSNGYTSIYTKAAWWAWQASRESQVVQLPEKVEYADAEGEYAKGYRQGMRAVVDQVEAVGLKVRS